MTGFMRIASSLSFVSMAAIGSLRSHGFQFNSRVKADSNESSQTKTKKESPSSSSSKIASPLSVDAIDMKALRNVTHGTDEAIPPPLKPQSTVWDMITRGYKKEDELWEKLDADSRHEEVQRGYVSHYTFNAYAANDPIEDKWAVRTELNTRNLSGQLYAVYDGHSGSKTSQFCANELFDFIEYTASTTTEWRPFDSKISREEDEYKIVEDDEIKSEMIAQSKKGKCVSMPFTRAFQLADATYLASSLLSDNGKSGQNGSCAAVCHINDRFISTAWVGDCRAVVARQSRDGSWRAIPLTDDHEIGMNPKERDRLISEHPNEPDVVWRNRVKGRLQPTRVFGDGHYKRMDYFERSRHSSRYKTWTPPYVTAKPDLSFYKIKPNDRFLIMASDGLFQDLDNQEVVDAVGSLVDSGEINEFNASTALVKETLLAAGKHLPMGFFSAEINLASVMNLPQRMKRSIHDDVSVLVIFFDSSLAGTSDQTNQGMPPKMPQRLKKLLDENSNLKSKY